jgi:hypothetical protein
MIAARTLSAAPTPTSVRRDSRRTGRFDGVGSGMVPWVDRIAAPAVPT